MALDLNGFTNVYGEDSSDSEDDSPDLLDRAVYEDLSDNIASFDTAMIPLWMTNP
jgi:hypothetical protein